MVSAKGCHVIHYSCCFSAFDVGEGTLDEPEPTAVRIRLVARLPKHQNLLLVWVCVGNMRQPHLNRT